MIDSTDQRTATLWVGSVGAGASMSNTVTGVTTPTTPGTYYLGAIADPNNDQTETDESNNALSGAVITISPASAP